jgi:hypothetical protein
VTAADHGPARRRCRAFTRGHCRDGETDGRRSRTTSVSAIEYTRRPGPLV